MKAGNIFSVAGVRYEYLQELSNSFPIDYEAEQQLAKEDQRKHAELGKQSKLRQIEKKQKRDELLKQKKPLKSPPCENYSLEIPIRYIALHLYRIAKNYLRFALMMLNHFCIYMFIKKEWIAVRACAAFAVHDCFCLNPKIYLESVQKPKAYWIFQAKKILLSLTINQLQKRKLTG